MFIGTKNSLETEIDYTSCEVENSTQFNGTKMSPFKCSFTINLTQAYTGEVKFYYGMNRFYQNNRQYLSSRSDLQLAGDIDNIQDCYPLDKAFSPLLNNTVPIVPCGQIANSMFNDSFRLFYHAPSGSDGRDIWLVPVPWTGKGVLTQQEIHKKFKNPISSDNQTYQALCDAFINTTQPPDWSRRLCDLGYGDNVGLGLENLDFMVWMKPAALPKFRKLYRILDTQSNFSCESVSTTAGYSTTISSNDDDGDKILMYENADASDYDLGAPVLSCQNLTNTTFDIISDLFNTGLPAGQYTLLINYNYPVTGFNGTKTFVIARETWVGPQNFFLPILYLVVGTFLILVSGFCKSFISL
ncbi:hypothetical protein WR25_06333 isoform B [Diploscapter pachys]|uniref:Cell cycle control protein 50A n=2 Tax=Diploscapter pachys TaxID=2018661 RepID=A0A2A2LA16_9BILA|nr:hypothetical protein WR25_06333 isoform B [Diploscapter pachys]